MINIKNHYLNYITLVFIQEWDCIGWSGIETVSVLSFDVDIYMRNNLGSVLFFVIDCLILTSMDFYDLTFGNCVHRTFIFIWICCSICCTRSYLIRLILKHVYSTYWWDSSFSLTIKYSWVTFVSTPILAGLTLYREFSYHILCHTDRAWSQFENEYWAR